MLEKLELCDFDKMFSIIKQSFPPDEYRPYAEQKELFLNEYYSVYALKDREELKAFISVWDFKEFSYAEHFAVNAKFRNCGIGSLVLKKLSEILKNSLCLEVEPPQTELAKRRIEFYKRNGFYFNDYAYIQPPISKGKKAIPLCIMTTPCAISQEKFEQIKSTLYKKVYKVE